jgi:hypothetical protein
MSFLLSAAPRPIRPSLLDSRSSLPRLFDDLERKRVTSTSELRVSRGKSMRRVICRCDSKREGGRGRVAADGQQRLEQRDRSDEVKSTYGDKRTSPDGEGSIDPSESSSRWMSRAGEQKPSARHAGPRLLFTCFSFCSITCQGSLEQADVPRSLFASGPTFPHEELLFLHHREPKRVWKRRTVLQKIERQLQHFGMEGGKQKCKKMKGREIKKERREVEEWRRRGRARGRGESHDGRRERKELGRKEGGGKRRRANDRLYV